ncbi:MAG: DUF1549 and DUF1553 domain-containing protein, partial [Verrucomicrobiota bacterium]
MWRYRDWVIEAMNRDMPYDQFLTHQLAGDEIETVDADSRIATTFLSIGPFDTIVQNKKRAVYDQLDDMVATTAQAFMGMTLQCARCHDHKFEPISQKDYYRFLSAFETLDIERLQNKEKKQGAEVAGPAEREEHAKLIEAFEKTLEPARERIETFQLAVLEKRGEGDKLPNGKNARIKPKDLEDLLTAMRAPKSERSEDQLKQLKNLAKKMDGDVRDMIGGEEKKTYEGLKKALSELEKDRPQLTRAWVFHPRSNPPPTRMMIRGDVDQPGEEVGFGLPEVLNAGLESDRKTGRRLSLARWMTGPGRMLTARVMVNRIWQYHFGRGFVEYANDLGTNGGEPHHPELLDWLAHTFIESGWTMKNVHRMIVLSSAYRAAGDSGWQPRRLEAEAIRD